ncbi:hypothetical protein ACKTEK_07345 [Tepidamorphus sp. 3E244]|uniref:hypothetical protein n=1 Tax=Tepidamorphus sp. 3E244 TaxID=3385498 RepID=UPI0038FCCD16
MTTQTDEQDAARCRTGDRRKVGFGRFKVALPATRLARTALGIALILGGLLWFLPVLGLWMLPLGVIVLSSDSATLRRWRRRVEVKVVGALRKIKAGFRN